MTLKYQSDTDLRPNAIPLSLSWKSKPEVRLIRQEGAAGRHLLIGRAGDETMSPATTDGALIYEYDRSKNIQPIDGTSWIISVGSLS
jgi:hypothetical protein